MACILKSNIFADQVPPWRRTSLALLTGYLLSAGCGSQANGCCGGSNGNSSTDSGSNDPRGGETEGSSPHTDTTQSSGDSGGTSINSDTTTVGAGGEPTTGGTIEPAPRGGAGGEVNSSSGAGGATSSRSTDGGAGAGPVISITETETVIIDITGPGGRDGGTTPRDAGDTDTDTSTVMEHDAGVKDGGIKDAGTDRGTDVDSGDGGDAGSRTICNPLKRDPQVAFLRSPNLVLKSYCAPPGYWGQVNSGDTVEQVIERLIVGECGFAEAGAVNIYDDAMWQIALALSGYHADAATVTERLRSGMTAGLATIRGYNAPFVYNGTSFASEPGQGWFFRVIAERYLMVDPVDGKTMLPGFPNFPTLHFEDWKPIAGENAWGPILGPLQAEYLATGSVAWGSPALELALSVLDAFQAMRSPIGAIYHAPDGTDGKNPADVSTENNASALAAFRMLKSVLAELVAEQPEAAIALVTVDELILGVESYFAEHAFDTVFGTFVQGGLVDSGTAAFTPNIQDFAVDSVTWPVIVLGPEWVVNTYGAGDPAFLTALWEDLVQRSGYPSAANPVGLGFSDSHDVFSSEWTFGAVLMLKEMARYLESLGQAEYAQTAQQFRAQAASMVAAIDNELQVTTPDGNAFLYANKRYEIPFGWWANPIPSKIGTAWALLFCDQEQYFNPFVLGGGEAW